MSDSLNVTEVTGVVSRTRGFPGGLVVKNPPDNAGDLRDAGSTPGSGRSRGEGRGDPLQYPCLENAMGRGAWRAASVGSQTQMQLSDLAHKQSITGTQNSV